MDVTSPSSRLSKGCASKHGCDACPIFGMCFGCLFRLPIERVSLPSPLGNGDKWLLSSPQVLVQQRVCLFRAFQHLGSFQRRGTSNPTRVFKINPTFLHKRTCRFSPFPSLVGSSDHVRSSARLGGIFT